jgi:hypothetical protein
MGSLASREGGIHFAVAVTIPLYGFGYGRTLSSHWVVVVAVCRKASFYETVHIMKLIIATTKKLPRQLNKN